jgi:small subunit ribosomal protein S20
LANHKSAEKRNKQSLVKRERNRASKSTLRTVVKSFGAALDKGPVEAKEALAQALPIINKSASQGIIHKKNASRKVSRLSKKLHKATVAAQGN